VAVAAIMSGASGWTWQSDLIDGLVRPLTVVASARIVMRSIGRRSSRDSVQPLQSRASHPSANRRLHRDYSSLDETLQSLEAFRLVSCGQINSESTAFSEQRSQTCLMPSGHKYQLTARGQLPETSPVVDR
jgi:hypothetical protein